MVADRMRLAHGAPQDIGMVWRVLADDKKCRLHVVGREKIEQFRSEGRMRPVVEGESDVGAFDVDGIKRDLRLSGRRCSNGHTRSRNRWNRSGALPGGHLRKQET